MLTFISKNIQKFLVYFFASVSIILVMMGVTRIKKPVTLAEAPQPVPPLPIDTTGTSNFTGDSYQTPWGSAVASIVVKSGKVVAVEMPSVPPSPPSEYAVPYLIDQALKSGSANIQGVSGATYTSIAFKSSLESAIAKSSAHGQTITPNVPSPVTTPTAKPVVPRSYRDDDDEEDDDWFDND